MTRKLRSICKFEGDDYLLVENYNGKYRLRWMVLKANKSGYETGTCLGEPAHDDKEMQAANIAAGNYTDDGDEFTGHLFADAKKAADALDAATAAIATYKELKVMPKKQLRTVMLPIEVLWVGDKPSCQVPGNCCVFLDTHEGLACSQVNGLLKNANKDGVIKPHNNCPIHGFHGILKDRA